jgi:hypothetical protein
METTNGGTPPTQDIRQPLLFKQIEGLDSARHKHLKLDRVNRNYRFVRNVSAVPVTILEFWSAGIDYPIIFTEGPEPLPLVALSYKPEDNLFVDSAGVWNPDTYIPTYVRGYPFAVIDDSASQKLVACVDAQGQGIGTETGEALFENDKPTAMLNEIMEFCRGHNDAFRNTRELGRILAAAGVLVPHQATVTLGAGREDAKIVGFQAVDAKKLLALPEETFMNWRKREILPAVYQHLHSLCCWRKISAAAQKRLAN